MTGLSWAVSEPIYVERLKDGAYVRGTPHSRALGFELVHVAAREGCLKAPWRADLTGDPAGEVIAAGVVSAMIDHVGGLAVLAALTEPGFTATLDLRIDTLRRPAPRKDLYAEARCLRISGRVAFVTAKAYEDDPEDPVAIAQGAFALTPAFAPNEGPQA